MSAYGDRSPKIVTLWYMYIYFDVVSKQMKESHEKFSRTSQVRHWSEQPTINWFFLRGKQRQHMHVTYSSWGSVWFWHSCSKPRSPWESERPPRELQYLHRSQLTSATQPSRDAQNRWDHQTGDLLFLSANSSSDGFLSGFLLGSSFFIVLGLLLRSWEMKMLKVNIKGSEEFSWFL